MNILVGYTGFVGSNLYSSFHFDGLFNSTNIDQAFGLNPDLCVYSGVRAEKFLANNRPDEDRQIILNAIENIKKINPKQLILISTIDVYKFPVNVDETTPIDTDGLHPYGANRYLLEEWVRQNTNCHLVVRLPGLFGKNIKKNFIYDLIHVLPALLNEKKFQELAKIEPLIRSNYVLQENGFYKCVVNDKDRHALKQAFMRMGFSALNFTDSRATYQFYNLACLWGHIQAALSNQLNLVNMAVEPLSIDEIYKAVKGETFVNEISPNIPEYNFKTIHARELGGSHDYIFEKQRVLTDICRFVADELSAGHER
ncbi:MAG TPA: sugar nucleotide-binding protein [Anaerolineaceae bacterium]|nr:sugar nucleotide-binding protein [Anaerolineaceae bacterium]HPN50655.1 sugar nucleotide-binding protein [Anaerolineaceae bacterium]